MTQQHALEADLTWVAGRFQPNIQINVTADGRIHTVGYSDKTVTKRLNGCAILPGMVNAHSHAFQRGLRGLGEHFPAGTGSFWSWRDSMYGLVTSLSADDFEDLCEQTFREMLAAGITTVGEFHYLHHETGEPDFAFDRRILNVAAKVGIRITLLNAYYETGGINQPLSKGQHRFETRSIDSFWAQMSKLEQHLAPETQSLGVVAHSIRAVPIETVCALHEEAIRRDMPFHMHIEEQRKEIEECRAAYGTTPMALINRETGIKENFAAVHCTHSSDNDINEFLDAGGNVVICPLTEANLGDGIPSRTVLGELDRLSLGSDSNARISMVEEMRWLEYGQRLSRETRGVFRDETGNVAKKLFEVATLGGATALRANAGEIRPGAYADFLTIDLTHPSLQHADEDHLLPAFVFGSGNEAIADVCVGGKWRGIREK